MIFGHNSRKTEKKNLVSISQFLKDRCFWEGSQLSSVLGKDERGRLVEFM
jgi:hypothetical protein